MVDRLDVIRDRASQRFNSGYNCAESVFLAGVEMLGKDVDCSVMTGFGGGMARLGGPCGALTGAAAAIGLACGRTIGSDAEAKQRAYQMVGMLFDAFRLEFGSEFCTELCGYDLSTPEGVKHFTENDTHRKVCTTFVLRAVELLSEVIGR